MVKMVLRCVVTTVALVVVILPTTITTQSPSPIVPVNATSDGDTADGPLTVTRSSQYCDWGQVMGPICVYNTTDQMVVVPEGLQLSSGQLELEIHEANIVHVYPTCISWIQIWSASMVSTFPAEKNRSCRTWLRIYNSRVGTVAHGVKDLTLVDAHVDAILLSDQRDFMAINSTITEVLALDWLGYRATVLNTTIGRLKGVKAMDSWYILGARLGYINRDGIVFNAREMSVINTTITHMSAKALTIKSGAVAFSNVNITYLEAYAIQVISSTGFLALSNITIGAASPPCFVLLDRERVSLVNVTVLGIPINLTSPFLQFLDDDGIAKSETTTLVEEATKECHANSTTLTCDFAKLSEGVEVRGEDIQGYQHVEVRNARTLQVASTSCQMELRLQNVNATLPHVTTFPANTSESCNVSVSARNSSLNVLWTKHVNSLNVTDSTIKRIHGGRLDSFWLTKSSVEEMDGVEVAGQGAVWNNSLFLGPINVTLKAPLQASSIHLPLVVLGEKSLTLDHPGETSTISGWRISWMKRHSIVVRRGSKLKLNDVVAVRVAQEAIYLEEGASVHATRLRALQDSIYVFSVASKEQVVIGDASNMGFSDYLIHVRSAPRSVDDLSNFTVSDTHRSSYCRNIPFYLQICDFSRVPQSEVVVDLANGERSNRVIIKGAAFVTLFPSCVEKVILMDVTAATTEENGRECGTWLEATGVHLTNVTSGVHDVTLTDCKVDILAPDRRLRDVDLEGTTVGQVLGVHWSGYTGVFNNTRLGKVKSLRADSRLMMSNSTVDTLLTGGMFLGAEAIIVNTTFKNISESGMTVNGSTRMQDVTIEKLAKNGIRVLDGLLLFVNVQILESDEESIVAGLNGGISFQNVTVGGEKMHWKGFLTGNKSPFNQSLIFLNIPLGGDKTTSRRPPGSTTRQVVPTTTEKSTQSSPKASSRVQWRTTNSGEEVGSSVPPELLVDANTSWKWAGAGIGFFMGLLVGCCIFIAVKVIKPNKGMLTMPTVFWRVKEDQHELLQEDQHVTEEATGARRDQGYSALPHSDGP